MLGSVLWSQQWWHGGGEFMVGLDDLSGLFQP